MAKLFVQYPYSEPEIWFEGTADECESVIAEEAEKGNDFSDAYYVWIEEDDEDWDEDPVRETVPGTRKPTNRAYRRAATRKAKRHLRAIEPLTYSVRQTRNGGIIHKGDTYSWLPEWKKANRRVARHKGKEICREYFEDSATEISFEEELEDDYPGGTWDTETQCFLWDIEEEISLGTHVIREIPNYNRAAEFLMERGLHEEFIEWLKRKEASHEKVGEC